MRFAIYALSVNAVAHGEPQLRGASRRESGRFVRVERYCRRTWLPVAGTLGRSVSTTYGRTWTAVSLGIATAPSIGILTAVWSLRSSSESVQKCGGVQKKTNANMYRPRASTWSPTRQAAPINGGKAPAVPPITMLVPGADLQDHRVDQHIYRCRAQRAERVRAG